MKDGDSALRYVGLQSLSQADEVIECQSVNITIDGKKLKAEALQTVYEAATANDIYIPALCHHPALPPEGTCRVCLVEIERQRALQPACTFPVTEGLVIHTNSPKVREARKFVLELIISDHPLDCMTCEATGDCRLQDLAYEYEVKGNEYTGGVQHDYPIDDPNPFIQVDRNKCILCRRCVRACSHINGVEAIGIVYRGFKARIAFGMDSTMEDSPCEFCGSCVEVCPVAALVAQDEPGQGPRLAASEDRDDLLLLRRRLPAESPRAQQ